MNDYFSWAKEPNIRFFSSGEATMEFRTMVQIYDEACRIVGPKLNVELQTNGYFSSNVADWIDRHVDVLWISADGPPDIHDAQRPTMNGKPSSDVVFENIKRFAKNSNMQFGIRSTIVPGNFHRQTEILKYFKEIGVKYVCGAPSYSSLVNERTQVPLLVDFARGFVPAYYAALDMNMFYQTHLMINFDEKVKSYCRACTTPVHPQLTTDGYVSCCDWASFGPNYLPGPLQQCIYGKWDKDSKKIIYYDENKLRIEGRNVETLRSTDCKHCKLLEHCAGGCIGKVVSRSGELYKMDRNWCKAVHYLSKHIPINSGKFPIHHS